MFDSTPINYAPQRDTQWSAVYRIFEDRSWLSSARKKLQELSQLPENWNTYGSRPIQPEAIETTAKLVLDLIKLGMPEPLIFPVSGGGIQLEWENLKCELEIEVMPNKSIEYLVVDTEGKMHEGQLPQYNNFSDILPLTDWFMKEKPSIDNLSNIYAPSF